MKREDERVRDTIHDALTRAAIDARRLSIEVRGGTIEITGSVPTDEQRRRLAPVVVNAVDAGTCRIDIGVRPAGVTPAGSRSESKHQTDR